MDNVVFYGSALLVLFGAITVGYLIVQLPWIRRSFLPASGCWFSFTFAESSIIG